MTELLNYRVAELSSYRITELLNNQLPRHRVTELLNHRITELLDHRNTELLSYRITEFIELRAPSGTFNVSFINRVTATHVNPMFPSPLFRFRALGVLYGGRRGWVGQRVRAAAAAASAAASLDDDEVGGGGRLAPGSPWGSRPGQGEEVGLVACKPCGNAAGETEDGGRARHGASRRSRRQPAEPSLAGGVGASRRGPAPAPGCGDMLEKLLELNIYLG